jgi:hypothetical protein
VRFSLHDEMSDEAPFGRSVLADIFRAFKQKQLLEDAIIIYRVQRAPERRVFYIDVAHVHPAKVAQHLEQIKNEIKQKKIPTSGGGMGHVETIYNPQSMNEDFFFAQSAEGRGSRVETLPAGENLGQIDDLRYWNNRLLRGLRVPSSYLPTGPDDGTQTFTDGRVGTAYIQEFSFACFRVNRLLDDYSIFMLA